MGQWLPTQGAARRCATVAADRTTFDGQRQHTSAKEYCCSSIERTVHGTRNSQLFRPLAEYSEYTRRNHSHAVTSTSPILSPVVHASLLATRLRRVK